MVGRRANTLSLDVKRKLIADHLKQNLSVKQLQEKYQCGKSQVYNTLNASGIVREDWSKRSGSSKRRLRRTENKIINTIVLKWFTEACHKNIRVSSRDVRNKALSIANELGKTNFKASNGWLESFKKRHNIFWKRGGRGLFVGGAAMSNEKNADCQKMSTEEEEQPKLSPVVNFKTEVSESNETPEVPATTDDENKMETEEEPTGTTGDEEATTNPWTSIKCIFCEHVLTWSDNPKLLECLHGACSACVTAKLQELNQIDAEVVENNCVLCPLCKVHSSHIIDNQFVLDYGSEAESVTKKVMDVKCTSCGDNAPASKWCVECAEYICDGCVQAHARLKITKDHTIKSKDEADQESQASASTTIPRSLFCSVHRQERLTLFCETCDQLTCRDCQLSEHRDHKYKFTNEIAALTKNQISALLSEVSYKRVLLTSAMKVIDERQNLIVEKKKMLVKDITNLVVKLTNAINQRGKQLVHHMNHVCDSKQKTLQEKKVALEQLSDLTDHCIHFVESALNKGSDMALLYSKKIVTTHLQRIKSRRADIPNPEIPVRIHLNLDKVPELLKVLSAIGGIVVDGRLYSSFSPSPVPPTQSQSAPPSQISTSSGVMRHPTPQVSSSTHPSQSSSLADQLAAPPSISPTNQMLADRLTPQHSNNQSQDRLTPQQASAGQMHNDRLTPQHPTNQTLADRLAPHQVNHIPLHPQTTSPLGSHPRNAPVTAFPQGSHTAPASSYQQNVNYASRGPRPQVYQLSSAQMANLSPGDRINLRGLLASQQGASSHYAGSGQQFVRLNTSAATNSQPGIPPPPPYAGASNAQKPYHRFSSQQQMQMMQQQQPQHYMRQQQQQHHQQQQQQQFSRQVPIQPKLWHIPQQATSYTGQRMIYSNGQLVPMQARPPPPAIPLDDSYKITLKSQPALQTSEPKSLATAVSSTIPKTPSPSQARVDDPQRNIDQFCQESVNDLMATIAKLDRNGIEVLPENKDSSSHVDSSTGIDRGTPGPSDGKADVGPIKDDPNEDWCAVCLDGGELVCCDNCPKVFHVNCHIPPLQAIPEESETWQCLLCSNILTNEITCKPGEKRVGLTPAERKIAERIVLELYCQYDNSLPFREVVGPEVRDYYEKIKKPIALDMIRRKLDVSCSERYMSLGQLIGDVRLMFRNAYLFNTRETQVYQHATSLEDFFEHLIDKWLPAYSTKNSGDSDSDSEITTQKKYRRILPLPSESPPN